MQALLASAPAAARDCLLKQTGVVAARNTCDGPWTQGLNVAIGPDPTRFGFGGRGSISLVITNALAAADQLLHGSNHLHYWGTPATPDATLLNVRGFDAASNRVHLRRESIVRQHDRVAVDGARAVRDLARRPLAAGPRPGRADAEGLSQAASGGRNAGARRVADQGPARSRRPEQLRGHRRPRRRRSDSTIRRSSCSSRSPTSSTSIGTPCTRAWRSISRRSTAII